jgi:proline iminopeptidase
MIILQWPKRFHFATGLIVVSLFFQPTNAEEVPSAVQIVSAQYISPEQQKLASKFLTGREFCAKFSSDIQKENGFRVSVPISYSNPALGQTEVFAYWAEGIYNPTKPTVLFFDGGPGGNSHGWKRLTDKFNQLHFDQRGIGCSRPSSIEHYLDDAFYGSEATARDAEAIRKSLGIEKLTIFGGSYGTIPATLYAHLFPASTKALILEGVIFSKETSEDGRYINYGLKRMYAGLPEDTKEAMRSFFTKEDYAYSLFILARLLMYEDNAFHRLGNVLREVFASKDRIDHDRAAKLLNPNLYRSVFFEGDKVSDVDEWVNRVLNCKEQSPKSAQVSKFLVTPMRAFEFSFENWSLPADHCLPILGQRGVQNRPDSYLASNYPVHAHVTYFQGMLDGATYPQGAIQHYKKVAKGSAQLFLAKQGGHAPRFAGLTQNENPYLKLALTDITERAYEGQPAMLESVLLINQSLGQKAWSYTKK